MHGQERGKMEFMAQTRSSGFCSEERLYKGEPVTYSRAPGEGPSLSEISGHLVLSTCYFKGALKQSSEPIVRCEGGKKGTLEGFTANRIPRLKIPGDRHRK